MKFIAHRGASHDAPENTLAAIGLAWQQGADGVEIDVHLSLDGEIIVMHDANTRRTTGFDGEIATLTRNQLKGLDAGAWKSPQFQGEQVPTLPEVLAHVPSQKSLVIEIKCPNRAIITALQGCLERSDELPAQIQLIGFDYYLMKEINAGLPQLQVLWLRGMPLMPPIGRLITLCQEAHFDGLDLYHAWPMSEAFVRRVNKAGLQLMVWTVDNAKLARRLETAGVDGVTTNRPGWLRDQSQEENA